MASAAMTAKVSAAAQAKRHGSAEQGDGMFRPSENVLEPEYGD
jgi:hypothetical protein